MELNKTVIFICEKSDEHGREGAEKNKIIKELQKEC